MEITVCIPPTLLQTSQLTSNKEDGVKNLLFIISFISKFCQKIKVQMYKLELKINYIKSKSLNKKLKLKLYTA